MKINIKILWDEPPFSFTLKEETTGPSETLVCTKLHCVTSQKNIILIFTATIT
jgi:hypothetical protein